MNSSTGDRNASLTVRVGGTTMPPPPMMSPTQPTESMASLTSLPQQSVGSLTPQQMYQIQLQQFAMHQQQPQQQPAVAPQPSQQQLLAAYQQQLAAAARQIPTNAPAPPSAPSAPPAGSPDQQATYYYMLLQQQQQQQQQQQMAYAQQYLYQQQIQQLAAAQAGRPAIPTMPSQPPSVAAVPQNMSGVGGFVDPTVQALQQQIAQQAAQMQLLQQQLVMQQLQAVPQPPTVPHFPASLTAAELNASGSNAAAFQQYHQQQPPAAPSVAHTNPPNTQAPQQSPLQQQITTMAAPTIPTVKVSAPHTHPSQSVAAKGSQGGPAASTFMDSATAHPGLPIETMIPAAQHNSDPLDMSTSNADDDFLLRNGTREELIAEYRVLLRQAAFTAAGGLRTNSAADASSFDNTAYVPKKTMRIFLPKLGELPMGASNAKNRAAEDVGQRNNDGVTRNLSGESTCLSAGFCINSKKFFTSTVGIPSRDGHHSHDQKESHQPGQFSPLDASSAATALSPRPYTLNATAIQNVSRRINHHISNHMARLDRKHYYALRDAHLLPNTRGGKKEDAKAGGAETTADANDDTAQQRKAKEKLLSKAKDYMIRQYFQIQRWAQLPHNPLNGLNGVGVEEASNQGSNAPPTQKPATTGTIVKRRPKRNRSDSESSYTDSSDEEDRKGKNRRRSRSSSSSSSSRSSSSSSAGSNNRRGGPKDGKGDGGGSDGFDTDDYMDDDDIESDESSNGSTDEGEEGDGANNHHANDRAGSSAFIGPAAQDSTNTREYYCDACQKGFGADYGRYQKHCDTTHLNCPIAGCGFFCKKGILLYESESEHEDEEGKEKVKVKRPHYKGEWKIQLHLDTLHYCANGLTEDDFTAGAGTADGGASGPSGASTKYLTNRRKNYPTADRIQSRVEELFYRAAKGEVLSDERRRWLRHHGVVVKRPPAIAAAIMQATAENTMGEASDEGRHGGARKKEGKDLSHLTPQQLQRLEFIKRKGAAIAHGQCVTNDTPILVKGQSQLACSMVEQQPSAPAAPRKQIMIVRRTNDTDDVSDKPSTHAPPPSFYVCTRCGVKGTHWLGECPTRGDAKYDKHTTVPVRSERKKTIVPPVETPSTEDIPSEADPADVDAPPVERSAREVPMVTVPTETGTVGTIDSTKESDTPNATGAKSEGSSITVDAAMAIHKQTQQLLKEGKRGREEAAEATGSLTPSAIHYPALRAHAARTDVYIPTLYDRLVAPEKVHGYGLLLQAFRYFTTEDFFGDAEYQPAPKRGARKAEVKS